MFLNKNLLKYAYSKVYYIYIFIRVYYNHRKYGILYIQKITYAIYVQLDEFIESENIRVSKYFVLFYSDAVCINIISLERQKPHNVICPARLPDFATLGKSKWLVISGFIRRTRNSF